MVAVIVLGLHAVHTHEDEGVNLQQEGHSDQLVSIRNQLVSSSVISWCQSNSAAIGTSLDQLISPTPSGCELILNHHLTGQLLHGSLPLGIGWAFL